jgi:hypothetical protein
VRLTRGGGRPALLLGSAFFIVTEAVFCSAAYAGGAWARHLREAFSASLGLAVSFLKPTSVLFAFVTCSLFLGTAERDSRTRDDPAAGTGLLARSRQALSIGSYAIYLMHGSVVLALLRVASPLWQDVLVTPAGPLVLGGCGILLPLVVFGLAERHAPRWARSAMFG